MGDHPGEDTAGQLSRVAAYEQCLRHTPMTALLHVLAPTRPFAAFYRRVGPRLDRFLIRASSERVASRLSGLPVLLLSTTGAKSGQAHTTPLLYVRDGLDFAVAGTNFGHPAHPGWTANLLADSAAVIEIGPERISVTAELADAGTRSRVWPRFLSVYSGYGHYADRRAVPPRVFLLHPRGETVSSARSTTTSSEAMRSGTRCATRSTTMGGAGRRSLSGCELTAGLYEWQATAIPPGKQWDAYGLPGEARSRRA
jgi:deazaflavin-dependent oxidoreductase (nitroreductase family)